MDPYQTFVELYVRSAGDDHDDHAASGSGGLSAGAEGHAHADAGHHGPAHPGTVLFLFVAIAVGALVRHVLKHTPIPYTVILICLGLAFGAASNVDKLRFLQDFTEIARMDPHLMLYIFLPTLIFESAFVMDVHTFKKTIGQALILAGPGLILCTALTALMGRYIFNYNWSWVTAMTFGVILSATDPVAVVALLKDLGASKQLGTIIEGESLLNDGAAIVLFNVLINELIPGHSQTGLDIFVYFIRVALGGPLFGYIMAKITIFWLSRVFNDALVEITITLASAYVTFYIGENFLGVSGVLAIVTLGIEINSRRTTISPEVEVFLHRFWGMLSYLANTLIFILVGVVIAQQAFSDVEMIDWIYVIFLYIGIMVIRFIVIGGLTPLLMHIGYSIDWKQIIVITWGGLRGAVGLALALVMAQTPGIPLVGSKVLFHTAGIVILTLLFNATTVSPLLKALGMSDISTARRLTVATAVRRINEAKQRAISMLKSDRFLADAHWEIVEKKTLMEDPYHGNDDEIEIGGHSVVANSGLHSHCPKCETEVPRVPHPKELAELAEDVRLRMLKAEKISYWRQFEQGMLGRQAVLVLINLADTAMDEPDRLITIKDIEPYWKIPFVLVRVRMWIIKLMEWKSTSPPKPAVQCCLGFYRLVVHFAFEWTLFGVIIVNIICTIVELTIDDPTGLLVLRYFNYVFCFIYIAEATLKVVGLRQYYFLSKWNIFDFLILLIAIVDIIVELSLPEGAADTRFSPSVIRIVRVLRILRVGRVLRLLKLALPLLIRLVDTIINRRLRFGYDIGKGFVVGEEELLQQFDRIVSMVPNKSIAQELRRRVEASRLDVIRSLGLMRKEHPGVALSVKTHQAIRSVLNHSRDTIKQLLGGGVLDESDAEKLLLSIEVKMKHLERTPASLPLPDPNVILCGLPWLSGLDDEILSTIQVNANLVQFEHEDMIIQSGEDSKGIYIIVSGLVKVTTINQDGKIEATNSLNLEKLASANTNQHGSHDHHMTVDFYGTGSVIGEVGILGLTRCDLSVECETDVQAFFIKEADLRKIMAKFSPVEERLWRVCGIHIATQLLPQLPEYQDWPISKLLLMCEGAYIATPPTEPVPTFEITEEYKEVIVVSGEVRCLDTREKLTAPCVVPRNIKYLMMNSGSPRLLVIPNADLQMENQEPGSYLDQLLTFKKKKSSLEKAKSILIDVGRNLKKAYDVILSIWNTLSNACSRKKEEEEESGESEGNSPSSDSMTSSKSSSCDHVAIEMEPEPAIDVTTTEATPTAIDPDDKPITPDEEKPTSPTAAAKPSTPVSVGKRVQTPVKPIKGAGPEANPSWISSNQNQNENETQESKSKLGSSENMSH